jgi:hypothetical protein
LLRFDIGTKRLTDLQQVVRGDGYNYEIVFISPQSGLEDFKKLVDGAITIFLSLLFPEHEFPLAGAALFDPTSTGCESARGER